MKSKPTEKEENWNGSKICHYLGAANSGFMIRYSDILEAKRQAELYLKKHAKGGVDSTIEGHLTHLEPKLGWFEDLEKEKQKLARERNAAFKRTLIGAIVGAFIGLVGSGLITYFTIRTQNKIANESSVLVEKVSSDVINELTTISQSIKNLKNDKDIEIIIKQINDINKRMSRLEKQQK